MLFFNLNCIIFSVLYFFCVYLHREQMREDIKIFPEIGTDIKIVTRLCKEAGIFPGKYYLNIIDFIDIENSYVFYGRDKIGYSRHGVNFEVKFLTLQFDILRGLIEANLLRKDDYLLVMRDTLTRYDVRKAGDDLCDWKRVVKETNKKKFVDYFINAFEKNIGKPDKNIVEEIMSGMPR